MHDAIRSMMDRYDLQTRDDYINALREILQEIALLGLWRSKFFEHAAFYGGTALRVVYGLDRYSEDLDFSLLKPDDSFSLGTYAESLQHEIKSFGFQVDFEQRRTSHQSPIESAFLKTNTYKQMIVIEAAEELLRDLHPSKNLKIKLEVDTDPPPGFETESHFVLQPIPFSVRIYSLPDLFAGKLHALLFRHWKSRVKGRDWYDLVWFASKYPEFRMSHLESRIRQSGDYKEKGPISFDKLQSLLQDAVNKLDVEKARKEVSPFVRDRRTLELWSHEFFLDVIQRVFPI
jgi:predicted nucleotidyltransferase component of viral defense system